MTSWRILLAASLSLLAGIAVGFFVGYHWSPLRPLVLYEDANCEQVQDAAQGYSRAARKICYGASATPIDLDSFRELGNGFAADRAYVYFQGSPVPGANPATFTVPAHQPPSSVAGAYGLDSDRVFSACPDCNPPYGLVQPLEGADPLNFTILYRGGAPVGYAKDSDQVWLFGVPVLGADAPSFELLPAGGAYDAVDAQSGYVNGKSVQRAIP